MLQCISRSEGLCRGAWLTKHAALRLGISALALSGAPAGAATASLDQLCVTEGALRASAQGFISAGARLRAVTRSVADDVAETRFVYLGPSEEEVALASGAMRRQFGLKLRAADACNLIYVMWRFAPASRLVVQIKSNPGQRASRECGNHGYQTVKPRQATALPVPERGAAHVLRAQLDGRELTASLDGRPVWQGELAQLPLGAGPVGVRADNAQVRFSLSFQPAATGAAPSACLSAKQRDE